ncbi:MAG: hypothetical protein IPH13_20340 [Planctomycetes bacterium]|nr:hypothetical protein [Planctomycetota bacterium]
MNVHDWKDDEVAWVERLIAEKGHPHVGRGNVRSYVRTQIASARRDRRQDVVDHLRSLLPTITFEPDVTEMNLRDRAARALDQALQRAFADAAVRLSRRQMEARSTLAGWLDGVTKLTDERVVETCAYLEAGT